MKAQQVRRTVVGIVSLITTMLHMAWRSGSSGEGSAGVIGYLDLFSVGAMLSLPMFIVSCIYMLKFLFERFRFDPEGRLPSPYLFLLFAPSIIYFLYLIFTSASLVDRPQH
jgi:uncharacterized membrane protein YhdT